MLVEVLPLLQQHDQLFAKTADCLRPWSVDMDVVAAGDDGGIGKRRLDQAQVRVALADERCHEMGAGHYDGIRLS